MDNLLYNEFGGIGSTATQDPVSGNWKLTNLPQIKYMTQDLPHFRKLQKLKKAPPGFNLTDAEFKAIKNMDLPAEGSGFDKFEFENDQWKAMDKLTDLRATDAFKTWAKGTASKKVPKTKGKTIDWSASVDNNGYIQFNSQNHPGMVPLYRTAPKAKLEKKYKRFKDPTLVASDDMRSGKYVAYKNGRIGRSKVRTWPGYFMSSDFYSHDLPWVGGTTFVPWAVWNGGKAGYNWWNQDPPTIEAAPDESTSETPKPASTRLIHN